MSARPVQQDYIVRQRFSNALPPPPGAPKLLEIKTGGLKQYCMPPYASRLARTQPLNIEADADLGMPIDLVGMPGVFEGDESSILAPLRPPKLHPADQELLRPLKSLGQTKKETDISFLRRTHYTADGQLRTTSAPSSAVAAPKRRKLDASKEDPKAILRGAIKGFDIANPEDAYTGPDTADRIRGAQPTPAEVEAWKHPRHPTNPSLRPMDFYPVIPDLDATPLDGGFMITRFLGSNPADTEKDKNKKSTQGSQRSEPRMAMATLRVLVPEPEEEAEYIRKKEQYEDDPTNYKNPGFPPYKWDVFLPETTEVLDNITRAYDIGITPSEYQLETLYTSHHPHPHFRLTHTRRYDQKSGAQASEFPYENVGLALNDGEDPAKDKLDDDLGLDDDEEDQKRKRKLQKAAYFVPIISTAQLKPRRGKADRSGHIETREEDHVDTLQVRIIEEQGEHTEKRRTRRLSLDPEFEDS